MKRFLSNVFFLLLINLTTTAALASEPGVNDDQDWPQFRGPQRSGVSPAQGIFDFSSGQKLKIVWKKKLGAGGYSQFVISGDKAYTMFSTGDDDYAVCLQADTGSEVWRLKIAPTLYVRGNADPGPLSTPAIAGNLALFLTAQGELYALNARTGALIWKVDVVKNLGGVRPYYGYSTSPLVVDDKVYVQIGGPGKAVVALDKLSGKAVWDAHPEPGKYSSTNYASPSVYAADGRAQILFKTQNYLTSAAADDGKILWRQPLGEASFATPMLLPENHVFVAGMNEGTLLKLENRKARVVWQSNRLKRNYSEPVYAEGYLYGYNDAFVACLDARNGKELWKSRSPGDGSLIYADGYLLVMTALGKLVIVAANPEHYQEVTSLQVLSGRTLTQPAVARGHIFVRNLKEIACLSALE